MRVGAEAKERNIRQILTLIESSVGEGIKLHDLLIEMLNKNIGCSDLLFLTLQRLEEKGYIKGSRDWVNVLKPIDEKNEIVEEVKKIVRKNRKLFVSPLEIGKFYQCPRRLFLEKVVLSREYKEKRGKVWDGELVHFAVSFLVNNLMKSDISEILSQTVKISMKKFKERITITKERLEEFLIRFSELLRRENFTHIFAEKTLESLRNGLVGTPDIILLKKEKIIPMDVKLGRLSKKGLKEEHLLQLVGEALLVEDFFRKRVRESYLVYFESEKLVKVEIDEDLRREFANQKRKLERICKSRYIPEKSRLKNFERRVCLGCHVRRACENIETLRNITI